MMDPLHPLAFSIFENKAVYSLLLGSGVSRAATIPTGWEITLDLVRRLAALDSIVDQSDWEAWYKKVSGEEPTYSKLLKELAATPSERRSILHSYIEPTAEDLAASRKIPTKAHRAIARLVQSGYLRVILTTNFDRLIENALRDVGVEPTVIASEDALKGAVPFIHSRCYLVKLHGDYLDTRILNTEAELSAYSRSMNALIDRIVDEHGLIVCGWSADWDPALRAALVRAPNRRFPVYWAARGPASKVAADLIRQRAARIIQIDSADTFFERLERLVSTQAEAKKQNPKSVELMVASAKRFLAKPEHRIELDDLIGEEVRRIARALRGSDFDVTGGPFSNERVVQSINRYEGLAEALVRILGVLGRWGAGPELKTVDQVLAQLGVRDVLGGFTRLICLRTYPGLLAFYGYGLGLLRADRYNDLFRLFSFEVANENNQRAPIVDRLLLQTWEGDHENNFKLLPDHEQRRTALSDHLHDVFKAWSSDTSFVDAEYTRLFEEFEFLGALAHITLKYSKADLQGALDGGNPVWCPMGRSSWDGQNFRKIVDRWKNEELIALMLQAGFAHRDRDFFNLANQNMERISQLIGRRY